MPSYLLRRLTALATTLLLASALVFILLDWLPGNAAELQLGPDADPEAVAQLATQLGLEHSAWQRYQDWLWGLLHGELGESWAYASPVADLIAERLQVTVPLALLALLLTLLLALATGLYAALHHGRMGDWGLMALTQLGLAVPSFWLAILLILLFAVRLQWVAAGGFPGWSAEAGGGLLPGLRALVLPALALALVQAAILARIVRAAVLDVLGQDFVRTARAKGLSPRATLLRHVLRNALVPVLTIAGLQLANLLAGTIVVENVFNLPGLGRLIFQAIANRDLIVLRNCVLLLCALVLLINAGVDLASAWADPRSRHRHA
ncbi:ABC transporter permease [Acidovorax sp. HDW3]|uniref:ABC transporter permease n=1 Tax=Acidovorax sp. HDW3 TaxID=2714923 RepID=UPI00140DD9A3|nr:ABC transporter permease [Acidovorax sp. HDW3]QIL43142.1 ABC transporter permease [Acidovorax sp. HDW3]